MLDYLLPQNQIYAFKKKANKKTNRADMHKATFVITLFSCSLNDSVK